MLFSRWILPLMNGHIAGLPSNPLVIFCSLFGCYCCFCPSWSENCYKFVPWMRATWAKLSWAQSRLKQSRSPFGVFCFLVEAQSFLYSALGNSWRHLRPQIGDPEHPFPSQVPATISFSWLYSNTEGIMVLAWIITLITNHKNVSIPLNLSILYNLSLFLKIFVMKNKMQLIKP